MYSFKCVIAGDGNVGKTSFVYKHMLNRIPLDHTPTVGVEIHPIVFNTTKGQIRFNIWDCAGMEEFKGLYEGHYLQADCAIIMFDVTDSDTYKHVSNWYTDLFRICPRIPYVLVGNKCDLKFRVVNQVEFHREEQIAYYDISTKSKFDFEKPFVALARQLLGDDTLALIN